MFTDLPGQIHVKSQGTNAVVTWTPEYNPKCFVVDWGTGKEDMHMKIVTTATRNFTLGNSNHHTSYGGTFSSLGNFWLGRVGFSVFKGKLKIHPDKCNS